MGSNWRQCSDAQLSAAGPSGCSGSLAQGLHSSQDSKAHAIPNIGLWDHFKALFPWGLPDPDDCNSNSNRAAAQQAYNDTETAIRDFMRARGAKPQCRGFE